MADRYGIILLDKEEVIIRIYSYVSQGKWKLLRYQNFDLAPLNEKKFVNAAEYVEIIAEEAMAKNLHNIAEWKIIARNISDLIIHDISSATGLNTEVLTLQREQELLCKGMVVEMG